jgi:hypothetical protein
MPRKLKTERQRQKILIPVRVTQAEHLVLAKAADRAHLPVSTYARLAALRSAALEPDLLGGA